MPMKSRQQSSTSLKLPLNPSGSSVSSQPRKLQFFLQPPPPPPSSPPRKKREGSSRSLRSHVEREGNNGNNAVQRYIDGSENKSTGAESKSELLVYSGYGDIEMSTSHKDTTETIRQQRINDQQPPGQIDTVYFDSTSSDRSEADIEWTPPDSSYGAACPVCGWIPKNIRQMIESILVLIVVSLFVAGMVKLVTPLTFFHSSHSSAIASNSTSTKLSDDDFYVEYKSYTIDTNDDVYSSQKANDDNAADDDMMSYDDATSSNNNGRTRTLWYAVREASADPP